MYIYSEKKCAFICYLFIFLFGGAFNSTNLLVFSLCLARPDKYSLERLTLCSHFYLGGLKWENI